MSKLNLRDAFSNCSDFSNHALVRALQTLALLATGMDTWPVN